MMAMVRRIVLKVRFKPFGQFRQSKPSVGQFQQY
jgi:hypothetical protein